jgi:hypothetical protein
MGYSFGQPPPGINGAGPNLGAPESNSFGCGGGEGAGFGFGERVGSGVVGWGVGVALAVAVALAVGEVPAVGEALPADEPAAPAQWSTVTVYGLPRRPNIFRKYLRVYLLPCRSPCPVGVRRSRYATLCSHHFRCKPGLSSSRARPSRDQQFHRLCPSLRW